MCSDSADMNTLKFIDWYCTKRHLQIFPILPLAHKPSSVLEEPLCLHTLYAVTYKCWWKYYSLSQIPLCITGVPCLIHIHPSYIMLPGRAETTPVDVPCWKFKELLLHIELPVRVSGGCGNSIVLYYWHPSSVICTYILGKGLCSACLCSSWNQRWLLQLFKTSRSLHAMLLSLLREKFQRSHSSAQFLSFSRNQTTKHLTNPGMALTSVSMTWGWSHSPQQQRLLQC